jgi:hypothetical protein
MRKKSTNETKVKGRSNYTIVAVTSDKVFLVDEDIGNLSVKNDAKKVMREILSKYGQKKIICQNLDGNWDELVYYRGRFFHFAPASGPEKDLQLPLWEESK